MLPRDRNISKITMAEIESALAALEANFGLALAQMITQTSVTVSDEQFRAEPKWADHSTVAHGSAMILCRTRSFVDADTTSVPDLALTVQNQRPRAGKY